MKNFLGWLLLILSGAISIADAQVVINEIHYDPSDRTKRVEFVEFHNSGPEPVNVSGWRMTDGVEYLFPANAVIAAGGYYVIAQDAAAFQAEFGAAPNGVFTGALSNKGERLRLQDAGAALRDEVTYGVGFPWPTKAKGGGGSIELIDPALDNDLGGSWRTAGTAATVPPIFSAGDSQWRYRKGTSEASNPVGSWRSVSYVTDGTWITNARMPIGFGAIDGNTTNVDVSTTLTDMAGTYRSIFLRRQFTRVAGETAGPLRLRVRCDDGCIVWLNGVEIARVRVNGAAPTFNANGMTITNAPEPPLEWNEISIPNGESLLLAGSNVIAVQVFNVTLNSSDLFFDAELGRPAPGDGTPAAQNSVYSRVSPPAIRQVKHTPEQPTANVPVTITAKVTDLQGVASVTLSYQLVDPGSYIRLSDPAYTTSWTNIAMRDDGTNGDLVAGDDTFTAVLPASVQLHRRLTRYRITASDSAGASVRVPYADDEQPNFAYFTYNGVPSWSGAVQPGAAGARGSVQTFPSTLLSGMQTWHLVANATDVTNSQYNSSSDGQHFQGTVIYEGKVYDHITFRNRGIGSTYVSGKNKWALSFNRARDIHVRDNWGSLYKETWNSFPIDAAASPWASVHRGMAGVEEAIAYHLYELAGTPSLRTHYMHWRVIDRAQESGPTQYDGDFRGLYMGLEPTEGNFLRERELPDGSIYAIEGGGGDKKHQGSTAPTDSSDWTSFRNASVQSGQTEAWYRANVDLPSLYTFLAINRFVGNVDVRGGDNFRFYRRPTDGRWVIIPYDMDMMALPAHHWGTNIDGVTYAGVPDQIRAITRHPAIAREFRNRARELLGLLGGDATITGGQAAQLVDEYAQMVNPTGSALTWAGADEAMWSNHPRTSGSGSASGQTSHRNNFYRTPYSDSRGGLNGTQSTNWTRTLPDPDADGYGTFAGSMQYLATYLGNFWSGGTWVRSNGNPQGYGFKYLEWESLYGGLGIDPATPDRSFPNTPVITYTGASDYPTNALDFTSTSFSPSAAGGTAFAAIQWRVGEISAPGLPGYVEGAPRKYEVEEVWTSPELTSFSAAVRLPASAIRPGRVYRARVRHKDANGGWSHWSTPVQFVAGTPSVAVYQSALVISEIMYNPAALSAGEFAAGFSKEDFEYIELRNVSNAAVDLTDVRFTKGVDFNFPPGFILAPGANVLVVKNIAAFEARYGTGKLIAGSYGADSLSNSGEQIKLSYGAGTAIRDFTYSDVPPWPTEADGGGYSLVRRLPENTTLDGNSPDHWRASLPLGGTPGFDDRPTFTSWAAGYGIAGADPLADADRDGLSDLLEYAFGTNPSVSSSTATPRGAEEQLSINGTSGAYSTLSFLRQRAAEDISYGVEFSSDLMTWDVPAVLLRSFPAGGGLMWETWRTRSALDASSGKMFGRLRITKP